MHKRLAGVSVVAVVLALLVAGCGRNQEDNGSGAGGASSSSLISSDPACKNPVMSTDQLTKVTNASGAFRLFSCVVTPSPWSVLWSYTQSDDNTPPYATIQRWTGQIAISYRQALQSADVPAIPDVEKGYDFGDSDWLKFCMGCDNVSTAQLYSVMWHNSDPAGNDNSGHGKLIAKWLVENTKP